MFIGDAEKYRHPQTHDSLSLRVHEADGDEIIRGELIGEQGDAFEIVDGIPRFCPKENYAESFGFQWNVYSRNQLDSATPFENISRERLFRTTGWPENMKGQRVLEAGSGMGRFTEVLADTGADVFTFDYSRAVEANRRNNGHHQNVHICQADIYNPPYEQKSFDKVMCMGVLQHCPSPKNAFLSLCRFLKPGGEIVVDVYALGWFCLLLGKYYVRPITRLLPAKVLHPMVKFHVGMVFPVTRFMEKTVGRPGSVLSWMLAVASYGRHIQADDKVLKELAVMDTFDMLAPAYDRPKTAGMVRKWCQEAALKDAEVRRRRNLVIARGKGANA